MTSSDWSGKRVLVTGVCGTVGKELLRQLTALDIDEVVGLDNNESELFFAANEYANDPRVNLYVADIRDIHALRQHMDRVEIVLHTAALKHVILCERSPDEAIQTNILATRNVIRAALHRGIDRVLFTSSDKAVNPTNVMGTSKLMCERLMTAANAHLKGKKSTFASTRFGNVLGSRGSVLPVFKRQIAAGGPVTLTDPEMTRFVMTLEDAVRLVMDSVHLARGGEVFVTKMHVIRIADLAEIMVRELAPHHGHDPDDVAIDVIGSKPGEKLYEELMNDEEKRRTIELEEYFSVLPAFESVYNDISYEYPGGGAVGIEEAYSSAHEQAMTQEELRTYLYEHHLLDRTPMGEAGEA